MATIGVIPTKTSIELRDPDGDAGTLPAATESAAGVMTAQHVKMLEEAWRAYRQGGSTVIVGQRAVPVDTSHFMTRDDVLRLVGEAVVDTVPHATPQSLAHLATRDEVAALARAVDEIPALPNVANEQLLQRLVTMIDAANQRTDALEARFEGLVTTVEHILRVAKIVQVEEVQAA